MRNRSWIFGATEVAADDNLSEAEPMQGFLKGNLLTLDSLHYHILKGSDIEDSNHRSTKHSNPIFMKDVPRIERQVSRRKRTKDSPQSNAPKTKGYTRVVVADDSEKIRELIGVIFNNIAGYTVRFAENGEEAWTSLHSEPFDLLITDIDMPGLSGIELVRKMRQHSLQQPAIFISGSLPEDPSGLIESLSPCEALKKPFSFADLLAKAAAMTNANSRSRTNGNSRSA